MTLDKDKNCSTCRYSRELEMTSDLKRNIQCEYNPPVPVAFATQQGIANMTVFPVVNEKMVCGRYTMRPTIIN